jgi:hypothetical protein
MVSSPSSTVIASGRADAVADVAGAVVELPLRPERAVEVLG